MGILFILLGIWKIPAKNTDAPTRQDIKLSLASKSPIAETRLYHGIALTKKDLNEMLEAQFNTYRLESELPIARAVISCESNWNINATNGISFGIVQMTKATWKDFGYGDIMNPQSQFIVMAKLFSKNQQWRWDCWCKIYGKGNKNCQKRGFK